MSPYVQDGLWQFRTPERRFRMICITLTVNAEKKRHLKLIHSNPGILRRDPHTPENKIKPSLTLVYRRP
jgi:hypothetical protein